MSVDPQSSISELFSEGFKIHENLENSDEPTNSEVNQMNINKAIELLELVVQRTDQLQLFSINEELEEISTVNLKYILAPAVIGVLVPLVQTPREERMSVLEKAEKHLRDFCHRCKDYAIGPLSDIERALNHKEIAEKKKTGERDLASMNADREAKISRFKRDKELKTRLDHFRSLMGEDVESSHIDEEVVRKYWIAVLEKWVDVAIGNIESINQEKEMVSYWQNMTDKNVPSVSQPPSRQQNNVPKTFILTRDKMQAQVFGAGYPSLPSMTVEEYYDSCVAAGTLPDQPVKPESKGTEEDSSDEDVQNEKLRRQREFDDFKDTHRRGDGNRMNMG